MASSSLPLRFPLPNPNKPKPPFSFRRHLPFPSPLSYSPPRLPPAVPRRGLSRLAAAPQEKSERWREEGWDSEEEYDAKAHTSTPKQFRYLFREVPSPPVLWPFAVVGLFLYYTRTAVLWELSNWRRLAATILGYCHPMIKFSIMCIMSSIKLVRSIYSRIVFFSPPEELCTVVILTSLVLSISEAISPDSVNEQLNLLDAAGLAAVAAVTNFVPEGLPIWLMLIGFFCYSKFLKKTDTMAAALPPTALLVAIGEPFLRILALVAFLAYAIYHHSKFPQDGIEDEMSKSPRKLPLPLVLVAFLAGIGTAVKWIGYRHLTWKVV